MQGVQAVDLGLGQTCRRQARPERRRIQPLSGDQGGREVVPARYVLDRLEERGFAEVHETGDKFSIDPPNRYIDHLREHGLLDAYAKHIADRSYQGEGETGRGAVRPLNSTAASKCSITCATS